MLKEEAEKLSQEQKIDITQIVREEWEIKILKVLFDSLLGKKIYFKGGTALRLAYGSPRFSEDLDFTQIKSISKKDTDDFLVKIKSTYPEIDLNDYMDKFYTLLLEFKIKEEYLPRSFSIKIEISKRQTKQYIFSLFLLTSRTTNLQVLANVENIESIYEEKLLAIKTRSKPRDLFDLWFISQKQKMILPRNLPKLRKNFLRQELNLFLPKNYQDLVKQLEADYGQ